MLVVRNDSSSSWFANAVDSDFKVNIKTLR